jgi:hypothetical protein
MQRDEARLFRGLRWEVGWGGWTRTNTVLINSEVSYQLDHAPVIGDITIQGKSLLNMDDSQLNLLD